MQAIAATSSRAHFENARGSFSSLSPREGRVGRESERGAIISPAHSLVLTVRATSPRPSPPFCDGEGDLSRRAFTLIELLVTLTIIAILAALLLPALASGKAQGRRVACISNLRQVGVAIQCYAQDYNGNIPYGPKAPPFTSPMDFYTSTGSPTSLLSLGSGTPLGQPVGLGLLLSQYLCDEPKVVFCPGSDQSIDADAELAKVGVTQAQGSYYYRHGGNTNLFDPYGIAPPVSEHIRLDSLGNNRNGLPIRALVMDTQFISSPSGAVYGIVSRTHHQQQSEDILFSDGHVLSARNGDGRFTFNFGTNLNVFASYSTILGLLEKADTAQ